MTVGKNVQENSKKEKWMFKRKIEPRFFLLNAFMKFSEKEEVWKSWKEFEKERKKNKDRKKFKKSLKLSLIRGKNALKILKETL